MDLERGPLSLVSVTEELLEWKVAAAGLENLRLTTVAIRCADHATPSIRNSWRKLRQAVVARSV
jgi:hypothetical protein